MFQALDLTTVSKPTKSFTPLNLGATASAPPIALATPAAPQGFFSNLVNGVKTFAYDFASAITAPAQNVQGPFSTTKPSVASDITLSTINSYANSLKEAGDRLSANQALFSDKTTSTPLERGISTVSAGIGVLGAFLAPLSAAGAGAEKIPVLGPIATGINNLFSAIGKGGADVAQGALYSLPFISDETKAKLSPLVQETGALAAQIAAGKAGGDVYDSFVAKTKELTARLSDHVAEVEKPTPSFEPLNIQKPVEAPAQPETVAAPTKAVSGETIPQDGLTPNDRALSEYNRATNATGELPRSVADIETQLEQAKTHRELLQDAMSDHPGKGLMKYRSRSSGELPELGAKSTVNRNASNSKFAKSGDTIYQDLVGQEVSGGGDVTKAQQHLDEYLKIRTQAKEATDTVKALTEELRTARQVEKTPRMQTETADGLKPSKVAKSIEQKAVESGISKGFNEIAGYDPITIKEQSERARTLISSDLERARAIIRGEEAPPENLKGTMLIAEMEKHIKENPSANLAYELANSPLVSGTSEAAQVMRLAAERTPDSATARIIEIKKAREAKIENAPKKRAAALKQANQAIKGLNLDQVDLGKIESFIDSFTC